jgi:hypothetical protein
VSIIVVILIGISTYIFIRNGLDTSNPDVSMSTSISDSLPKRQLYDNEYALGLGVYVSPAQILKTPDIDSYFTVIMYVYELNKGPNDTVVESIVAEFPFKACKDIQDTTLTKSFIHADDGSDTAKFASLFMICPDVDKPEELFTISNDFQLPYRTIRLKVMPCSKPSSADCEMNPTTLSRVYLNFGFVQTSFIPSSKESPLKRVPLLKDFRVDLTQEMKYEISLKGNQIHDDEKDFSDKELAFSFIDNDDEKIYSVARDFTKVYCAPADVNTANCPPYNVISFRSSGKTLTIVRKYPKFLGTMGEIGGTAELIVIIVGFFYMFYNSYFQHLFKRKRVLNHNFDEYQKVYKTQTKKQKKELNKVAEEIVHKRDDIIRLYQNQTSWEVIQGALFKDYHRKLFPLVRLHMEKMKWDKEKQALGGADNTNLKEIAKMRRMKSTASSTKDSRSMERAYELLKISEPQNEIEKAIKDFFMENIPENLGSNNSVVGFMGSSEL